MAITKSARNTDSWKYMAGTERTGEYLVLGDNAVGRLGIRLIPGGVRIRIEPKDGYTVALSMRLTRQNLWKQPGDDGENRFSKVLKVTQTRSVDRIIELVEISLLDLKRFGNGKLRRPLRNRLTWRLRMRKHFAS